MDTRDALVIDAFAPSPLTGTPVGLVLDGATLAADQRERVAAELSPAACAFVGSGSEPSLRLAGEPAGRPIHVGVAVGTVLAERSGLEDVVLALPDEQLRVSMDADGRAWVDVAEPELRDAAVTEAEAAAALGIDPAAIRDVAADLPIVRASLGRGVLAVPVNFLEHLSRADPDREALAGLLERTGTACLYAYTFDTLSGDRDVHGLAVDAAGGRARTTGEGAACAAAAIRRHGAMDHDRDTLRFEAGDLRDRPARLTVRTADGYAVGGRAVTAIDGTIAVPPADDGDDIIEA